MRYKFALRGKYHNIKNLIREMVKRVRSFNEIKKIEMNSCTNNVQKYRK